MKKMNFLLVIAVLLRMSLTSEDSNNTQKVFLDLTIKETPEIVFNHIVDIVTDENENIYVLDSKEKTIYVFDEDGKYLNKIGRPGQGPGEFQRPCSLFIDTSENLYVLDDVNRRIEVFDHNDQYVKSIKILVFPGGSAKRVVINSSGEIYVTGRFKKDNQVFPIAKFSNSGEFIKFIPLPIIEYDLSIFNDREKERAAEYLIGGSVCIDNSNRLLFSHSWPYLILSVSEDDRYMQISRKTDFNWIPMIFKTDRMNGMLYGGYTQSIKIFILGKYFVNSISVMDWEGDPKKEISSVLFASDPGKYINLKERYCVLDLYSEDLKYVASEKMSGNIIILNSDKKGRLLGIRRNENDEQIIERYRIDMTSVQ